MSSEFAKSLSGLMIKQEVMTKKKVRMMLLLSVDCFLQIVPIENYKSFTYKTILRFAMYGGDMYVRKID